MKRELANYIFKLNEAGHITKRAEDRSLHKKHLAGAAVILALVESGSEKEKIQEEVQAHERLWGNAWQKVKDTL